MKSKNSISITLLSITFFLLNISLINAQTYVVENGAAFFKAKISFNSYTGTSEELSGAINFETGVIEFSVPTLSIKTPNKKRNKHMYELVKAEENTTVSFKGNLIDFYDDTLNEKQTLKIRGDFTLAGATKEIELTIDLTPEQNGIRLKANWTLLITDYGLEQPTKAFLTVKDEHEMSVDAFLINKK